MTHIFLLDLELTEPTALTDGSSDAGGGHTTLDHIPGSSLLGAFATALGIAATDPLFSQMFLSPATRFLNAYPDAQGNRSLPRPLTFRVGKLNRTRAHDSLRSSGEPIDYDTLRKYFSQEPSADTMKSSRGAFVAESAPEFECAPHRVEQVHVGIDRSTRAAQDGVLFTYEAVRAGSKFHGAIETDDDAVAQKLDNLATCSLRIGRSRGAGYGHAKVNLVKSTADWREHSTSSAPSATATIVTLLSDYMPHLESAPAAALCAELAALARVSPSSVEVSAANTRQVRGFRGVWGLPRPTRTALAKGSVITIQGRIDAAKFAEALRRGIGARINEGFGRLAVNWSIHGKSSVGTQSLRTTMGRIQLVRPNPPVTRGMTAAIEARRIDRKMREFVEAALRLPSVSKAAEALMPLPPAQLGNLRAAVSGTMSPAEIGAWFKALSEKTAGNRWKKIDVPALLKGNPHRAGHAFVWESLFGGSCDAHDALNGAIDPARWKQVIENLARQLDRSDLAAAATAQDLKALRYFIAGLVSDVSRRRNTRIEKEVAR